MAVVKRVQSIVTNGDMRRFFPIVKLPSIEHRFDIEENVSVDSQARGNTNVITKGVTEDFFAKKLNHALYNSGFSVIQNMTVRFLSFDPDPDDFFYSERDRREGILYYPDIVISGNEYWFGVDIEIDEPYIGDTGEPIHYIGGSDSLRDERFANEGWFVIRFSEEQIIVDTKKCIDFVLMFLDLTFNFYKSCNESSNLTHLTSLIRDYCLANGLNKPQWTKEEAQTFAATNFRNTYLGSEIKTGFVYRF